jgi:hypothetical protein
MRLNDAAIINVVHNYVRWTNPNAGFDDLDIIDIASRTFHKPGNIGIWADAESICKKKFDGDAIFIRRSVAEKILPPCKRCYGL